MTTKENEPEKKTAEEQEAIDQTTLFDAVSGAIDEVTITPENKDDDNPDDGADPDGTPDNDDGTPDGSDDDGSDKDDGNEEEPEGGKPKDEEGAADDDAAGKTKDDGVPEKEDGKTGDADETGDGVSDKLDPVNDPIPESTNEKTAERIKSLIGLVKGKNDSEAQRDEIVDRIQETGTDPEQYANTLGFLQMYNSTDPAIRKQALEVARGVVKELALELGEGASVTSLSDHDDLQAEVEAGTLTEARAIEMAATREQKVLTDSRVAATVARESEVATTNANIVTGTAQLDAAEAIFRTDKNYVAMRPTFINLLKPVLKRTNPTEWGAAAQEVYAQVKLLPVATTTTPKPKQKPKNTPLRPKGDAGSGSNKKPEGGTAVDAVNDALANM